MRSESTDHYIHLFENLSAKTIAEADKFVSPDIRFVDPFNDIAGIEKFRKLLFKTLSDVDDPRFNVTHRAEDGDTVFLRWQFDGRLRGLGDWSVTGMSELHFDSQGRVLTHLDHWDAASQFYARLPVLGPLIRLIRRRLQVS